MGTTSSAVSVIIPTFNRAAMLSTTLESFAARSIAKNRYGVVVVDDGIADRRLLEEHLKAHKQYPQESVAILGYTTWAPPLSVTSGRARSRPSSQLRNRSSCPWKDVGVSPETRFQFHPVARAIAQRISAKDSA
jgi:glycosyltransferase involved in cell wall biosynthesis